MWSSRDTYKPLPSSPSHLPSCPRMNANCHQLFLLRHMCYMHYQHFTPCHRLRNRQLTECANRPLLCSFPMASAKRVPGFTAGGGAHLCCPEV